MWVWVVEGHDRHRGDLQYCVGEEEEDGRRREIIIITIASVRAEGGKKDGWRPLSGSERRRKTNCIQGRFYGNFLLFTLCGGLLSGREEEEEEEEEGRRRMVPPPSPPPPP